MSNAQVPSKTIKHYRFNTQIKIDSVQTDTMKQEIDSMRTEQNSINKECKKHIKDLLKIIEAEEKNKKELKK
tara:strand:+ start:767 stop:982 length:216 start_codon:yes stop_codon:yes gene_type:complete